VITIGIDPGWATFGMAINVDGKIISRTSFEPRSFLTNDNFIWEIHKVLVSTLTENNLHWDIIYNIYIERFVAYAGVQSSASEDILMLIGALDYFFASKYSKPILVKAIDWKIKICRHLVKTQGFSNPRKNLDKKFSLLAAELLSGGRIESDHEADAVCLSNILQGKLNGDKRK
jgi:hypothetical protein